MLEWVATASRGGVTRGPSTPLAYKADACSPNAVGEGTLQTWLAQAGAQPVHYHSPVWLVFSAPVAQHRLPGQ